MIVIFDTRISYIFFSLKKISSTWGNNCGIIIRDINETKAKIFHTLYTLIHSQAVAIVYSREKRIFDLRTRQGGGKKNGRVVEETIRGRWERGGFVYRDSGRWGQKRRVRKRAQHVFLLSRSFRSEECDPFSPTSSPRLLLVAETQAASRHTYTHTHTVLDLFRSSIILFYFLVRHCLARSYLLIYRPPPSRNVDSFLFTSRCPLSRSIFLLFLFPSFYSSLALILSESLSTYRVTRHMQLPFRIESKEEFIFRWIYFYRFSFLFLSCSIIDRGIAMRKFENYFYCDYYYVFQLEYFLEALEKFR